MGSGAVEMVVARGGGEAVVVGAFLFVGEWRAVSIFVQLSRISHGITRAGGEGVGEGRE